MFEQPLVAHPANDPLQLTDYCNVSSTERKCQVLLSLLDCTAQNNEDLSP